MNNIIDSNNSNTSILENAKNNYIALSKENDSYTYGWRWGGYSYEARKKILFYKNYEQVLVDALEPGKFEVRFNQLETLTKIQNILNQLPDKILNIINKLYLEEPKCFWNLGGVIDYYNRKVSAPLFHHAIHIASVLEFNYPEVILEIGGGYGGPCFQWFSNKLFNPKIYVIVDIPESLFYAEVFLKLNLINVKITHINPDFEFNNNSTPVIFLCSPDNLHILTNISFNLIFNTGSLGEMSGEWVEKYINFVNSSNSDYYLTHNRFCEPLNFNSEIVNTLIPFPNSNWIPIIAYVFEGEDPKKVRSTALVIFNNNSNKSFVEEKFNFQELNSLMFKKYIFLSDLLYATHLDSFNFYEVFLEKYSNSNFSNTNEFFDITLKLKKLNILNDNNSPVPIDDFGKKNITEKLVFIKHIWLSGNPNMAKYFYEYYDINAYIKFDSLISMIYVGGLSADLEDKVVAEVCYKTIIYNKYFNDPIGKILFDLLITMLNPNVNDDISKILNLYKSNIEFLNVNEYI